MEARERRDRESLGKQLTHTMCRNLLNNVRVVEVYSPPRVAKMAESIGLRAGWPLDLITCDEDGRPWNFDQLEMRNRAIHKLLDDNPTVFIGSPMCTAFSSMNNVNYPKMDPQVVAFLQKDHHVCTC